MSTQPVNPSDPRTLAKRCFTEVITGGDLAVADEILAKDILVTTANGSIIRGRSEFKHFAEAYRNAFPDITFEIQEEVVEGTRVCTRYVMRGTFLGTLMGLLPTGNAFAVRGMDVFEIVGGKIVRIAAYADTLLQMQQLGVVPKL